MPLLTYFLIIRYLLVGKNPSIESGINAIPSFPGIIYILASGNSNRWILALLSFALRSHKRNYRGMISKCINKFTKKLMFICSIIVWKLTGMFPCKCDYNKIDESVEL